MNARVPRPPKWLVLTLALALALAACGMGGAGNGNPPTQTPAPTATTAPASPTTAPTRAAATAPRSTATSAPARPATPPATARPSPSPAARATASPPRAGGTALATGVRSTPATGRATPIVLPTITAERVTSDWGPTFAPLAGGRGYSDPGGRFSFSVPPDWTEVNTVENNIAFGLPGSAVVAAVGVEDTGERTLTLERVRQQFDRELRGRPDYQQLSNDRVVVDGRQAYKQVLRRTDAEGVLQLVQVYLVDRGVVHILSFVSSPEDFARWAPVFDGITGTYKVGR